MSFEQLFADLNKNTSKMNATLEQIKRDTEATRKTSDKQLQATKAAENEKRRDKADLQKADNPDQKIVKLLEELNKKLDGDKDNPSGGFMGGVSNGLGLGAGLAGGAGIAALGKAIGAAIVTALPALLSGGALAAAPLGVAAGFGSIFQHVRKNTVYGGEEAGEYGFQIDKQVMELERRNLREGSEGVQHRGGARSGTKVNLSEDDKKELERLRDLQRQIQESRETRDEAIKASSTPNRRGRRKGRSPEFEARLEAEHQERVKRIAEANPLKGLQTGGYVWNSPIQMFQRGGGVFKVPGNSTGDNHNMMVPTGSFVLNRNASKALSSASGFQTGGLVPIKAESQEMIFGPGSWGGHIPDLNSMIPRFQTGGLVQAKHPDTGSGWSMGKDGHGRPAVFTKEAAEALAKAIRESGGVVKTSDITSSRRSPDKNAAAGGALKSNHLSGNAVDIHGASKIWLKQNGLEYGWKNLVYSGHDGHFDFVGKSNALGTSSPDKDSKERTSSTDDKTMGAASIFKLDSSNMNSILTSISSILSGDNLFAKFALLGGGLGGVLSAGAGMLGDAFSGLSQSMGLGGTNPGMPSVESTPLTGSNQQKAQEMYQYIKDKGYTSAQAKGIVANIQRESTFNATARSGDDGGPGGLFQWKGSRQTAEVGQLVDSGNWKGQIDYALRNDVGPQYKAATANMNAFDASMWWAEKWERPASLSNARNKHASFLPSYQFGKGSGKQGLQTGGMAGGMQPVKVESGELIFPPGSYGSEIPMLNENVPRFQGGGMTGSLGASTSNLQNMITQRFNNSNTTHNMMSSQQSQPIVVPVPMGGGGSTTSPSDGFGGGAPIPSLTSAPSNHIVSSLMMSSYSLMQRIG